MQYLTLLLVAATAVSAAAVSGLDKRLNLNIYCAGTNDDGGSCNTLGFMSQCCRTFREGQFQYPFTALLSERSYGHCLGDGLVYCVQKMKKRD
ncbi:hypothetical protein E4U55_002494 [Claviceps digitariae]|nr:hypothetical protein E4U55_002494 [Claviceps digitariae]